MGQNNIPVAKQVKSYINRKPFILEAIEQDIVNYSALARQIGLDLGISNFDTIKAALIRLGERNRKVKKEEQKRAISILRDSSFSVKNKIAALELSSYVDIRAISYTKTPSGYMFFIDENIAKKSNYKKIEYGLAIIHIRSPKSIENTPGAIAFMLSSLASEGINVTHFISCREDTFFVVKEHVAPLAFDVLSKRLRI